MLSFRMLFLGLQALGARYAKRMKQLCAALVAATANRRSLMASEGMMFPDFKLPDQDGVARSLADYAGKWLIVYFYPKDGTPGCSLEAANFASLIAQYEGAEAHIVGVSADAVKRHAKFSQKLNLPFTLLSDEEHTLLEAVGVWREKKMAGRLYMGVVRTTFLVDPHGCVRYVWAKVKVDGHAEAVLDKLKELQGGGS